MRDGKATFAKAAEMAKLPLWEFADLVKQCNIEWVRYTPEEVGEEFKGVCGGTQVKPLVFKATP
jgi:predicted HTH domain antitoxin